MILHVSPTPEVTGIRRVTRGFALAVAAALVAAAVSVAAPATAAPTTITISGHVTEDSTGKAIENIEVALYPEFSPANDDGDYPLDWKQTTASGGYSFKNVKPGKYRIEFTNYFSDFNVQGQFAGGMPGDLSGDIESTSYTQSTVVDIALAAAAEVSGRLVDASGKAIKNADVGLTSDADPTSGVSVSTDKNGKFEHWGIAPGDATLWLSGPSKTNFANTKVDLDGLSSGESRALGDITLTAGASISGIVTKSNGSVSKGHLLFGFRIDEDGALEDEPYGYGYTNSHGEYSMKNLPAGDFVVADVDFYELLSGAGQTFAGGSDDAYSAVTIPVTKGGKTYRDVRLGSSVKLGGTVTTASGKPASTVPVFAIQNDYSPMYNYLLGLDNGTDEGTTVPVQALAKALKEKAAKDAADVPDDVRAMADKAGIPASTPVAFDYTDSKGRYSLSGLAAGGSYTAYFGGVSGNRSSGGLGASADVVLTGATSTLNAQLKPTALVKGTTTDSSGKALPEVLVHAIPYVAPTSQARRASADGDTLVFGYPVAYTDDKGRYELRLPAGDWVLQFSDYEQKLGTRYLGGGTYPSDPETTKLSTGTATVRDQDVVLSNSGANIAATILTAEGGPEIVGDTTLERIVDGQVVDSTTVESYSADWYYVGDQFPLRRIADGDYRLRIAAVSSVANYSIPESVTDFTVTGAKVTSVNGETPASTKSLGTITLEHGDRITPVSDAALTISADGPLTVGTTLHADLGQASGNNETVLYQWYRDGSAIGSAFGADYVVQPGDVGARLTFAALPEYSLSGFLGSAPNTSEPTGVVADGEFPLEPGTPVIDGSGAAGSPLTVVPAGDASESYDYQWRINGVEFIGATKSTFTPQLGDLGDTISVSVATDGGDPIVSNRVVVTKAKPVTSSATTATVLVGGKTMKTSRLGAVLTAKPALTKSSLVVSYQWEYATAGSNWAPLPGKDRPTLTLSKKTTSTSKIGYSYRVVITAERAGTEAGPVVTSNTIKVTKAAKK